MKETKVLIIGYGNPGSLDDGLGPACAEAVAGLGLQGVTVDTDYQLAIEDAVTVAAHDVVIFADAAVSGPEPFSFAPVRPAKTLSFTTHSVEPETMLAIAHEMFGGRARGYTLGIRGYEFNEFGERLSERARRNLQDAVRFVAQTIREGSFPEAPDAGDCAAQPATGRFEMTRTDLN